MKAERFQKVEELFHKARALDAAERASFLDEMCGSALDLRADVESLLAHSDGGTSRIHLHSPDETPPEAIIDRGPVSEGPGSRIGPYKILQQIGEGGFGVVYMAEQQAPVQRRVALKIIKLGMDTRQVIARFEAERQALAMMDHPNIARVLEAGATETGRPYFVMELVKGIPIVEYCNRGKLSTRQRLDLFLDVCHAVQHAHQKGVIHRDLKPSNVLVTLHDTKAVPKVIDFGIAKATSHRLTEKTLFTEFRYFIGTPEYMSPDQAEISGLDVDTRTDIYSLGVLLYELLTNTTPFDPVTLRQAGYGEIQRIIREVEPPKPSTRLDTLVSQGADTAQHQQAEPGTLSRLMRGDLDWIVMKAMEKDRTRRYQSTSEFSADIERYLTGQAVMAGPPSVVYKFRKFVQRHRLGVTAAALITAALVTGLSVATAGLVEARQEARHSQRIADFLQDLFVSTNPEQAIAADADVESVLATAREIFGEDHATVAATLSSRALQLQSSGDLEAAEELYGRSLRIWRDQFGDTDVNVGSTLGRLGLLLVTKGDNQGAEEALRSSIEVTDGLPGGARLAACEPMTALAGILANRGEFGEAEQLMEKAVSIRRAEAPQQRLQIAITMNAQANILVMSGNDEKIMAIMPDLLEAWRQALPPQGVFLARILTEISVYYVHRDHQELAEPGLREALEIFRARNEAPTHLHAVALLVLTDLLQERGDDLEAIPMAFELVDMAPDVDGGQHFDDAVKDLHNLGWHIARDPEHTEQEYRAALDAVQRALAEKPDTPAYTNSLGVLKYRLGDYEGAVETLTISNAHYAQEFEGGAPCDLAFMAMAHSKLGQEQEARALMEKLRAAMKNPACTQAKDNWSHLAEAEAFFADPGKEPAPAPE
ncbi:MAG: protein kinase domain-containing protein [Planctomycetota bacterium]|jgi:serine/threonine protein kinase/tetratricopeptide (TPR) repeat protein